MLLLSTVAFHAVAAVVAGATARRLGPRVFLLLALAPLATLAVVATKSADVVDGVAYDERVRWVDDLGLALDFRLDAFSLLMVTLVSGVGVLIFVYSRWYFSPRPGLGRFAGTLVVFSGSMLGLVLADHVLLLYVFWELTSVTSYLLIGFEDEKGEARAAALQALLITGAGGLAMLGGFVLIGLDAGTYSLSAILADPPSGVAVEVGLVLVLLGAFTKSAQVPFHFWLPGAMAAPTPVSAYLHSATMVKAGVYLLARFAPAFASVAGWWRPVVVAVGCATMVFGGYRALRQHDIKLLMAQGTVSQLGFMVALVGAGVPELTAAGAALILAHGLFKAALFMVVGVVDHQAHERDLRALSGVGRRMPLTFAAGALAAASMVGLPPLVGFITKELAFDGFLHADLGPFGPVALAAIVVGSVLTVAYGARFVWGAFATKPAVPASSASRPRTAFVAPAAFLAALGVLLGVVPTLAEPLIAEAGHALDRDADLHGLSLWHGVNAALLLSVLAVGAGVLLFAGRVRVEALQARFGWLPSASAVYERVLAGVLRGADKVTAVVQNGSLPVYLGVILLTVLVMPGSVLVARTQLPETVELAESPLQVAIAALVVAAALGVARSTRRLPAVLFLGAAGYGVALLFVIHGAPDLALTQFLIETLSLVIFVLVLRHLPRRFEPRRPPIAVGLRVAVAAGVGVFVASFAAIAAAARTADPVSREFVARSLPEAGGRNIVNVILVDFRGYDTLGEITVLAVAALGVTRLVVAGRRERGER